MSLFKKGKNMNESNDQLIVEWTEMKFWIRNFIFNRGFNKAILGLSGGFDSGFLAYTSSQEDCLGKDNVIAVSMPCNSSADSIEDAKNLSERLKIQCLFDDITESVQARVNNINSIRRNTSCEVLESIDMTPLEIGNVKARMRMITLYGYAPFFNALVMNTSNHSEFMVGNGTKYGDMAGDFAPILNYTKTRLYKMAKAVGFDKISPEIFNKIPSADLEPNQTDEGTMGVSYIQLDSFLDGVCINENGESINTPETENRILDLMHGTIHKRQPMPNFYL